MTEQQSFSNYLARLIAAKLAKTPDEANAMAAMMIEKPESVSEMSRLLGITVQGAEALAKVPGDYREDLAPIVQMEMAKMLQQQGTGAEDETERIIKQATLLKAISGSDEALRKEIEDLKKTITEQKEAEEKLRMESLLQEVRNQVAALEQKITQPAGSQAGATGEVPPPPPTSWVRRVNDTFREIDEFTGALEAIGYKVHKAGAEGKVLSEEEMAKTLQERGFKVERTTITADQLDAKLKEREQQLETRLKKEVEEEMGLSKLKVERTFDLVKAAIDVITREVTAAWREAKQEELRARLSERVGQQPAEQPQPEGAGTGAATLES